MNRYYDSVNDIVFWKHIFSDLIAMIIVLIIIFWSFGTVSAGQRGVLTRFGAVTGKIYDEGLYFKLPIIEKVVKMDVQIQKSEVEADAASKDLQSVDATIALNYHLDKGSVEKVYQEVRKDYVARIISPAIQESVKAATAQFTAEELITKRPEVRDVVKRIMSEKLATRGIVVDDFSIVNFNFSKSFDDAIEAKVTAEQNALAAKNKLEQIKFEAQQKIESAMGNAEAIRVEANALRNNPDILQLRALEKWDGVLPQVTGGAVPFINIK